MNKHELTIIIPCYNCEKTLVEAVESCYKQDLDESNFEIIMVDDGSTDSTQLIIKKLADKYKNIIYLSHSINKGGGATRNTAIRNSSGNLIFCLDGDDILPEKQLPKMIDHLKTNNLDGVMFSATHFFSGDNKTEIEIIENKNTSSVIELKEMFQKDSGFIARVNFLYTRRSFEIIGGYPEHHGFDTQTFGFIFLLKGLKAMVCKGTYYLHRRHANKSYFEREYLKGKLSLNTYLMHEKTFFLFSDKVKDMFVNFNISINNKLGKKNLESSLTNAFDELGENNFFINEYKKYITTDGEERYRKVNGVEYFDRYIKSLFMTKTKFINKCTLLMHNGGRLGNQLYLMAGLYAYCLEKNRIFDPKSFFEYQEYFNIPIPSKISYLLGKVFYFAENTLKLPESVTRDIFYGLYTLFAEIFALIHKKQVVYDAMHKTQVTFRIFVYKRIKTLQRIILNIWNIILKKEIEPKHLYFEQKTPTLTLLPPSRNDDITKTNDDVYIYGWHFRNPIGIIKYQKEISEFFKPKENIVHKINSQINDIRSKFKYVIGVHIRLGDVVNEFMDNDRIAYSEVEVLPILNAFLVEFNYDPKDAVFMICSDGKISKEKFNKLNIFITNNNHIEDMWLLSKTDTIIGADSSFAIMASLLGNKPFIVFKRGGIDWQYYKDKSGFFENKFVKRFIY